MNRLDRAASAFILQGFLSISRSQVPGLLKAELLLDHPRRMHSIGADGRFGSFNQIIQSALRRIRQHSAHSRSHGDAEADLPSLHLVSHFDSLVAGIRIDQGLLAVQEIRGWG